MITQTYYIATGAKNAMYTLRCRRDSDDIPLGPFAPDFYVLTLAADSELAAYKATLYVGAMRDRIESDYCRVLLDADCGGAFERRGKLSVRETRALLLIEDGIFPFGKFVGQRIEDAAPSYLLWLSDKVGTFDGIAMNALAMAAQGEALRLGHIAKRQAVKEERAEFAASSGHVGTIGARQVFAGVVDSTFSREGFYGMEYTTRVRVGADLIVYVGSKDLGVKVGKSVTFKATISKHDEYKDVKSTKVSRPVLTK